MSTQIRSAPQAAEDLGFQTECGRDVRVGRLALGDPNRPVQRVSLDIGHCPGRHDSTWAALTPAEARHLAAALLRQAAAAEDHDGDHGPGRVEVSYLGGELYGIATGRHAVLTDQPASAGGEDAAMTPTDLLVASLSSCVAFYAGRYLARHGLSRGGLQVTAEFTLATDRPARVGEVALKIRVPGGVPPGREAALLAVASHCTVHNTLRHPPGIAIELDTAHDQPLPGSRGDGLPPPEGQEGTRQDPRTVRRTVRGGSSVCH